MPGGLRLPDEAERLMFSNYCKLKESGLGQSQRSISAPFRNFGSLGCGVSGFTCQFGGRL